MGEEGEQQMMRDKEKERERGRGADMEETRMR